MSYEEDQLALVYEEGPPSECKSCGKAILWVPMAPSRKLAPIDVDLDHGGNIELRRNKAGKLFAGVTGPDPERKMFLSHFVTCPQAKEWRR